MTNKEIGCTQCPYAGHIIFKECPDAYTEVSQYCGLYNHEPKERKEGVVNDTSLDEAIKHCEEEAKDQRWQAEVWEKNSDYPKTAAEYLARAEEYEQLAEWLKELKVRREEEALQAKFSTW